MLPQYKSLAFSTGHTDKTNYCQPQ